MRRQLVICSAAKRPYTTPGHRSDDGDDVDGDEADDDRILNLKILIVSF